MMMRMMNMRKISIMFLGIALFLAVTGCKKKVVAPPPPPPPVVETPPAPPPPPAKPAITQFAAEPSTIQRGQSSTLRWEASDATDISINQGVGAVQARGTRQVNPTATTTYTLSAKGPGGSDSRTTTVTVTVPPPPPAPAPPPPTISLSERLSQDVQDAFFDYDKSDIRDDARATLTRNSDALKAILRDFPNATIQVEGHCDERGSAEYNLGLGDRRATAAKEFLVQLGVSADRLKTISEGKERPQCTEANEACYQKNRRAHFVSGQ
jgi:peptidoglycan-associated lipoprotein